VTGRPRPTRAPAPARGRRRGPRPTDPDTASTDGPAQTLARRATNTLATREAEPTTATRVHEGGSVLPLYTPGAAARLLAVRESWLRRKAAARAVPCTFLGRHLRFSRADLEAIAQAAAHPPHTTPEPSAGRQLHPSPVVDDAAPGDGVGRSSRAWSAQRAPRRRGPNKPSRQHPEVATNDDWGRAA
jgi:excisionase family DNA binding protein